MAYYRSEEQPGTRIIYYSLNRCANLPENIRSLVPVIASDWLHDKAYLVFSKELDTTDLRFQVSGGSYPLPGARPQEQTQWWVSTYRQLQGKSPFSIEQEGENLQLDPNWASCVQVITKDYLRLTERE